MKKLILILAVVATAAFAQTAPKPAVPTKDVPNPMKGADPIVTAGVATQLTPVPDVAKITAERDQAKAQLQQMQAQQQQQAVITEYYKIVAERNEALLRISQLQIENADLKSKLAAATPAPEKK